MTKEAPGQLARDDDAVALRHRSTPSWLMDRGGWVYIMTNRPNGTLYIGVTGNLPRRAYEHRERLCDGFTKQHGLTRLVWFERFEDIRDAIHREKRMKTWLRAWKTRLVMQRNPDWEDLYDTLA